MAQLKLNKPGLYSSTIEFKKMTDLLIYVDDILALVGGFQRNPIQTVEPEPVQAPVEIPVQQSEIIEEDSLSESESGDDIDTEMIMEELGGSRCGDELETRLESEPLVSAISPEPEPEQKRSAISPEQKCSSVEPIQVSKLVISSKSDFEELLKQTNIKPNSYKNYTSKWNDPIWELVATENLYPHLAKRTSDCPDEKVQSLYNLWTVFFKLNEIHHFCDEKTLNQLREVFKKFTSRKSEISQKKTTKNAAS